MSACSNCGEETDLYYHGLPICVDRGDSGAAPDHILPVREPDGNTKTPSNEPPD